MAVGVFDCFNVCVFPNMYFFGYRTLADFGLVPRSQVLVMASVEQEEEQSNLFPYIFNIC